MSKVKSFFYLFSVLFLVWLGFTATFQLQELALGLTLSFLLSLIFYKTYVNIGFPPLGIKRFVFALIYIIVVFKEIVKANLDVAYRAVHPKIPINPGIVIIRTNLNGDVAKTVLANSITLTPGTFTLDVIGDRLLIHWINVESKSEEEATKLIGERFERYLRIIFA
ncbi:MAG: Na+/H+ antiporter subunit E [Candidatus Acetothermia bacterium]